MRQGASDAAELAAAVGRDRARSHLARGGGGADRAAWGRARAVQEVGIRVLYRTQWTYGRGRDGGFLTGLMLEGGH